jgi:hypothetical protein
MFGWCWHRWGKWEDADGVTFRFGEAFPSEIQVRYCKKCNKQKIRNLTA